MATFTAVMRKPPPFRRCSLGLLLHRPAAVNEIMTINCLEEEEEERGDQVGAKEKEINDDGVPILSRCRLLCHQFGLAIF